MPIREISPNKKARLLMEPGFRHQKMLVSLNHTELSGSITQTGMMMTMVMMQIVLMEPDHFLFFLQNSDSNIHTNLSEKNEKFFLFLEPSDRPEMPLAKITAT
ncbi:MAG: hypothetical protein GXO78_12245 [Calditrichaeota bacterium]|nr:hypothetical protein [Calditrichota bacterium]